MGRRLNKPDWWSVTFSGRPAQGCVPPPQSRRQHPPADMSQRQLMGVVVQNMVWKQLMGVVIQENTVQRWLMGQSYRIIRYRDDSWGWLYRRVRYRDNWRGRVSCRPVLGGRLPPKKPVTPPPKFLLTLFLFTLSPLPLGYSPPKVLQPPPPPRWNPAGNPEGVVVQENMV